MKPRPAEIGPEAPAIVKPAAEDASIGVEQRSVVRNARQLAERVLAMHDRWDDVLVQKYVDGREVNVGILGDRALPVAEIMFDAMPRGMWRSWLRVQARRTCCGTFSRGRISLMCGRRS